MKMVRKVVAQDADTTVEITMKVTSEPYRLTKDEAKEQADSLQEKIALLLVAGDARFLNFYLRNVRCL